MKITYKLNLKNVTIMVKLLPIFLCLFMDIGYTLVCRSNSKFFIFLLIKRLGKHDNKNLPSLKF